MPTDPSARVPDEDLGADLCALLHQRGAAIRTAEPVTGGDAPTRKPRAFRVVLADGQVLKAVRAASPRRAALVFAISHRLDPAQFAPVLAHSGAALLMPWIEGQPLHVAGWDLPDVQHAGRLLAALHALALPDGAVPEDGVPVDFYTQKLRAHIGVLARRAAIAHDEATALFDLAMAHAPAGTSAAGVVHRDLCPENIVRRPSGALCVIDLESAAIGACAYDLARTWYRWPMAPEHRAALFTAYADHGGVAPEWRHFPFWALCAVTVSAAERRVQSPEIAFAPLRRLSALLRALRDGVDGKRLALQS